MANNNSNWSLAATTVSLIWLPNEYGKIIDGLSWGPNLQTILCNSQSCGLNLKACTDSNNINARCITITKMWFNKKAQFIYNCLSPHAPKSTPKCHIDIGRALEKLTVQHLFSCSSHLSNRRHVRIQPFPQTDGEIYSPIPTTMEMLTFHGKVCLPTCSSLMSWTPDSHWVKKIISKLQ